MKLKQDGYYLLRDYSANALEAEVYRFIKAGWVALGGPCFANDEYVQAIVRGAEEGCEESGQDQAVSWQARCTLEDGSWSGWTQAPSQEEADALVARYKGMGRQAEWRALCVQRADGKKE